MRVKMGMVAQGNERFAATAFDHNIGLGITVNIQVGGQSTAIRGGLVDAKVSRDGRQVELTIDVADELGGVLR